ncbi:MAG: acyl-CoA dehydrogenase family protein [candidate division WOR-3 bacterium]
MEYFLSEEQKRIKEIARDLVEKVIKPARRKYDEGHDFPYDIIGEIAREGLFKIFVPKEYGGSGGGVFEMCIATEEIARGCGGVATAYAVGALGGFPIVLFASEEQKKKYLPRIATGEMLCAFALTEPDAGSDAGSIKTTAQKDGDFYILNGVKQFITNGGVADVYTVIAITDRSRGARGASAFLVEKGFPGFSAGKEEDKLGIRASLTAQLLFEDCRVHKDNLMGREGMGFIYAMKNFDRARPGVGALALGIAQGAFEAVMEFGRDFGLLNNQFFQEKIADMATEIEAGRALTYACARMIDSGVREFSKDSSFVKLYCSDVAMRVTLEAINLMGPYGVLKDYGVEKMARDAKITQIYEGTNEIQRTVIGLELIREMGGKR